MTSDEHSTRVAHRDTDSAAALEERLEKQREDFPESNSDGVLGSLFLLFLFGLSLLAGVASTRLFGTWPAQLVGGFAVALLVFAGSILALYVIGCLIDLARSFAAS